MAATSLSQHSCVVQTPISSAKLTFNSVHLNIIDRAGQPWIRSPQIGEALGYAKGCISIAKLYDSHADEFTDAMTAVVTLPTEGGPQETRIFSLRGCHLLAMFARTPVAKEFRRWVLDVLETWETARAHQLHLPSAALTPFLPAPLPLSPFPRLRTLPKARRQELNDLVLAKLAHVPPAFVWKTRMSIWTAFNSHFSIPRYNLLPEARMGEAVAFLSDLEIGPNGLVSRRTSQLPLPMDAALRTASALSALIEQARDVLAALPAAPAVREVEA